MQLTEQREGETALSFDPAGRSDGSLCFIGRISSPWSNRATCPKNMTAARDTGQRALVTLDAPFRRGLVGLKEFSHIILLSWFDRAQRNLIVQKPRHASDAKGVFALRSPVRPNPIGLHVVRILDMDIDGGTIGIDAIDVLDGTPLIDIKPYFLSVDAFPDALRP